MKVQVPNQAIHSAFVEGEIILEQVLGTQVPAVRDTQVQKNPPASVKELQSDNLTPSAPATLYDAQAPAVAQVAIPKYLHPSP